MKLRGYLAWREFVKFIWNFFSIGALAKTLLVPFHQENFSEDKSLSSLFERVVFNIIMRVVGAVARIFIIVPGILLILVAVVLLPLFVLFHLPINPEKLNRHRPLGRDLSFRWTPHLRRAARELSHGEETYLIGKEESLARLEQVLARENQNNALIVGDPGVGRRTLAAQFAKRASTGRVLPQLRYKHVFELSLEGLAQEDVMILFSEAARAGNVVVVIDNIHKYVEVFDSLLAFTNVPSLNIVGITDTEHYHSVMKTRGDLLQSFEKIEIKEPAEAEVQTIIAGILTSCKVTFDDKVPEEIVRLTNRLVMHVPQPEKSLDVIEELLTNRPKNISVDDVHKLMSLKTGVPVGKVSENERDVLVNLENNLRQLIIGQESVISGISEALRRGRSGISSQNRPIGSFLFLGPTGVGKTHTAKQLARAYYGSESAMVRFDMTEFNQESSASELSKRLVVAIEENPFTLILFDEIEKADKEVLNLFLQILDEARITDASGREVRFINSFIICTSNAGSEMLISSPNLTKEKFVDSIIEKGMFRPEFINRFDGVFLYNSLTLEGARGIAGLMLSDFAERMKAERNITIEYEEGLPQALADTAYSSTFGAREIRRTLEHTVESYIASLVIDGRADSGSVISVPTSLLAKR